jgi:hypothetical protein
VGDGGLTGSRVRWVLGPDRPQQLVLQGQEVAADLCQIELVVLVGKGGLDLVGDGFVGQDTLVGRLCGVVAFGHLRAVAVLGDQLLLG